MSTDHNPEEQHQPEGSQPVESDAHPPADSIPAETTALPTERRLSRRASWLAMGLVLLALGLLWMAPATEDVPAGANDDEKAAIGRAAPLHYTLKDMNGVDVKLESFKGKIILLNFWATWCDPCKIEIPDLVDLQKQYQEDIVVLGFSIDDSMDQLKPFAAEYKVNYPLLLGLGREDVQDAYGPMWALPSTVIIGRDGRIARKFTGIRSREQFEQEIRALL
jgi:peroxiredoxin